MRHSPARWRPGVAPRPQLFEDPADHIRVSGYFEHVDRKLDLRRDVRFNTRVTGATFDDAAQLWRVRSADGRETRARHLLPCLGFAAKAYIPDIEGLERFAGPCHHTARWPQDGLALAGQRVGFSGTGASGVQVIQE